MKGELLDVQHSAEILRPFTRAQVRRARLRAAECVPRDELEDILAMIGLGVRLEVRVAESETDTNRKPQHV